MKSFDIAGAAGSKRLTGIRWFDAGFADVYGALVLPADELVGQYNLSIYGSNQAAIAGGLAVLDTTLLAVRKSCFEQLLFDRDLEGEHNLSDLDWCYRGYQKGARLGAAPLFGIMRHANTDQRGRNWFDCVAYFREKHRLPDTIEDLIVAGASIPLPSPTHAIQVIESYFNNSNRSNSIETVCA